MNPATGVTMTLDLRQWKRIRDVLRATGTDAALADLVDPDSDEPVAVRRRRAALPEDGTDD